MISAELVQVRFTVIAKMVYYGMSSIKPVRSSNPTILIRVKERQGRFAFDVIP